MLRTPSGPPGSQQRRFMPGTLEPNTRCVAWYEGPLTCLRPCSGGMYYSRSRKTQQCTVCRQRGTKAPKETTVSFKTPDHYDYSRHHVPIPDSHNSVVFDVKAQNDAHVALGETTRHDERHYEIVLGGWGNSSSVIRDRNQGVALATHNGRVHSTTGDTQQAFWICWADDVLRVGKGREVGQREMMWSPMVDEITIRHMCVSTGWGSKGKWNIHATQRWTAPPVRPGCFRTPNHYDYSKHHVPIPEGQQSVTFRVKAKNDAHVALGENTDHNGRHYEIVLGGCSNTLSVIRAHNQGPALATHPGNVLDEDEWREFWVAWSEDKLRVGVGSVEGEQEILRRYSTRDDIPIRHMCVSTGWGSTGEWAIDMDDHLTKAAR